MKQIENCSDWRVSLLDDANQEIDFVKINSDLDDLEFHLLNMLFDFKQKRAPKQRKLKK